MEEQKQEWGTHLGVILAVRDPPSAGQLPALPCRLSWTVRTWFVSYDRRFGLRCEALTHERGFLHARVAVCDGARFKGRRLARGMAVEACTRCRLRISDVASPHPIDYAGIDHDAYSRS